MRITIIIVCNKSIYFSENIKREYSTGNVYFNENIQRVYSTGNVKSQIKLTGRTFVNITLSREFSPLIDPVWRMIFLNFRTTTKKERDWLIYKGKTFRVYI